MNATIKLRTDKINKDGTSPLIIRLHNGPDSYRIPTNLKVPIKDFNDKLKIIKKSNRNYNSLNIELEKIKTRIDKTWTCFHAIRSMKGINLTIKDLFLMFKVIYINMPDDIVYFDDIIDNVHDLFKNSNKIRISFSKLNMDFAKLKKAKDLIENISKPENQTKIAEILDLEPVISSEQISKNNTNNIINNISNERKYFLEIWKKYLEYYQATFRETTYKKIKNKIVPLIEYVDKKNIPLGFNNLDEEFGNQFKYYLDTDYKNYITKSKGLNANTTHEYLKSISAFLNWSYKRGYSQSLEFKKWDKTKPETDLFYLQKNQINELYNFILKSGSELDIARDLFVFSCFTGMRYGDIVSWKESNLRQKTIEFYSEKCEKKCIVGIAPITQEILSKYNNKLPFQHNSNLNENIKKILREMNYINVVQKKINYKKKKIMEMPFCDAITFHSGRRTFINLMVKEKVSLAHLSTMTGDTVKSLMIYYKDNSDDISDVFDSLSFNN